MSERPLHYGRVVSCLLHLIHDCGVVACMKYACSRDLHACIVRYEYFSMHSFAPFVSVRLQLTSGSHEYLIDGLSCHPCGVCKSDALDRPLEYLPQNPVSGSFFSYLNIVKTSYDMGLTSCLVRSTSFILNTSNAVSRMNLEARFLWVSQIVNTVNSLLDITSLNSSLYSTAATDIKHCCNKSTTFNSEVQDLKSPAVSNASVIIHKGCIIHKVLT